MVFQAPRRFFLETASKTQPTYSYSKRSNPPIIVLLSHRTQGYLKVLDAAILGAFHASEIPDFFGFSNQTDFIATDAVSKCTSVLFCPNDPILINTISLLCPQAGSKPTS